MNSSIKIKVMSGFLNHKQKENTRLDPLSTLIKLAILPYKPNGTKLSIANNYIYYSENTILQFAIRTYFGDSYNDLRDLRKSLHKAVAWYYDEPKMKYLFENAIIGLDKLKNTYGDTGKADAVQSYIDILSGFNKRIINEINREKDKIKNQIDEKKVPRLDKVDKVEKKSKSNNINNTTEIENLEEIDKEDKESTEENELKIHNILKLVWTDDDKEIVSRFFNKLKNSKNMSETNDTINSLEALLISIHKQIEKEVKILSSI
jgi:hypothetical protein